MYSNTRRNQTNLLEDREIFHEKRLCETWSHGCQDFQELRSLTLLCKRVDRPSSVRQLDPEKQFLTASMSSLFIPDLQGSMVSLNRLTAECPIYCRASNAAYSNY